MAKNVFISLLLFCTFGLYGQITRPFKMNMSGMRVGIYEDDSKNYDYTDIVPQINSSVSSVPDNNGGTTIVVKTEWKEWKEQRYRINSEPYKVEDKDKIKFITYLAERIDGKKCKMLFQINSDFTVYVWMFIDKYVEVYFCDTPVVLK